MNDLVRRVIIAYERVHPATYPHMVWRISRQNCEALAGRLGAQMLDTGEQVTIFGIPVEIVDSYEILLAVKA